MQKNRERLVMAILIYLLLVDKRGFPLFAEKMWSLYIRFLLTELTKKSSRKLCDKVSSRVNLPKVHLD